MSTVVALGETDGLQGFVLAGVTVMRATTVAEVEAAWHGLAADVGLVILSPNAARILESALTQRPEVLTVVTP
jgi:vacuolar-type H+-ATPase subunit F/Vma7